MQSCRLTFPVEVVLKDCHERGHLTEDKGAVVGDSEFWQHPVQDLKLPRRSVQLWSAWGDTRLMTSLIKSQSTARAIKKGRECAGMKSCFSPSSKPKVMPYCMAE